MSVGILRRFGNKTVVDRVWVLVAGEARAASRERGNAAACMTMLACSGERAAALRQVRRFGEIVFINYLLIQLKIHFHMEIY